MRGFGSTIRHGGRCRSGKGAEAAVGARGQAVFGEAKTTAIALPIQRGRLGLLRMRWTWVRVIA